VSGAGAMEVIFGGAYRGLDADGFDISAAADGDIFEPLLTAEEAADRLRIHVKTLQKLAREQRVPCVRIGKYWRFRLSALDHWVAAQQNQTSQPFRVE
jgi:excisionase family DNA binding protein